VPGDPETFPALLARNTARHGHKPVVIADGRSITHAGLDAAGRDLAARLVPAGVAKSSRVGVLMPNGVDWAVIASAVTRIGATLVPLSTLLRPPELLAQLQTARVTQLVLAEEFRGRSYLDDLHEIAPGVAALTGGGRRHPAVPALRSVWTLEDLPQARVGEAMIEALEEVVRPADDLVILFTSGSRGSPKGVIHTQGSAIRATAAGLTSRCVGPDERLYIPMPFFWTGGFSAGFLTVLVAGATLLTEAIPDPETTLGLLERERVTLFRGWPDQAARLAADPRFAQSDLSTLGPGSLPAVLPADRRPVPGARANLFGMTETFGPYCGDRLDTDLPQSKHGSCGRPFLGIEVRIVDSDTGTQVPAGDVGEIRLRGPNLMRGLCGRTGEETFDDEGFYPTRDLGSLDDDGYLWYHGRLDDMFKVKGATVYPAEVEAALRDVPGVRQAFVTSLLGNDGDHTIGALVVSGSALDEVAEGARARLSSFKLPTRWYLTPGLDEVPVMATGKVDLAALRRMIEDKGAGVARRDGRP
jgi:acyl-CoA synthetase (AMP-forming)/AMP-acid ligase II